MRIRTTCSWPELWVAVDDDTYDGAPDSATRNMIGVGNTNQEAIDDLFRLMQEKGIRPAAPSAR